MPLQPGDKLGYYEILGPLGAGGMGEVYRAHDSRLKRDVAIKVLPAALALDPDRMARFEREARLLASLDHPNIGAIYGLEDSHGTRALILALIEGPTLADRIAAGPIPLEDAIHITRQMAEALEYAHDRGVMHRDLKPANVKITPEGTVKVLDFGLAKALIGESDSSSSGSSANNPTMSPTLSMRPTEVGMILGTAAYMAPEQAKGKNVDRRADIWAFGVVLFEMLAGEHLFTGDTAAEVMASAMKEEPKLDRLPAATPLVIRRLIERCLNKDPKQRLQAIGEARILLHGPMEESAEGSRPAPFHSRLGWVAWGVAGALAAALAVLAWAHFREQPALLVKFEFPPPEKGVLFQAQGPPAVSRDGRRVAFVALVDGKRGLWVRDLDSLTERVLPGTDDAQYPFWAPDSRQIGFGASGKLMKIDVTGGPATTIANNITQLRGGAWNDENVVIFSAGPRDGLSRVSAFGGVPTPITELDKSRNETFHLGPQFLPDGSHFLYQALSSDMEKNAIFVGDLQSKDRKLVVQAAGNAQYVEPNGGNGYVLYARERTLMAQPFDAGKLRTTGDAVPTADRVDFGLSSYSYFGASRNGVLAYSSGSGGGESELTYYDRSGKVVGTAGPPGEYRNVRLSPDEKKIAFDRIESQTGNRDIWVMDTARGVTSRLTFDPATDNLPIWSPDGLRILYPNRRTGSFDLYIQAATGAGQEELLIRMGTPTGWCTSWSRDGRFIMYQMPGVKTGQDLWIAPQFGDRKPFPYLQTHFNEQDGAFSPDGHWVAYLSDESGRNEIYVQSFPLSGAKFQISTGGGTEPTWRNDGKELFYSSVDRTLMAAPVKSGATFEAGAPKSLFRPGGETGAPGAAAFRHTYAVTNDGLRFLVAMTPGGEKAVPMTVVLNWQAALKK